MIESLVDKSLLRHRVDDAGRDRYWMLETIREYADERLVEAQELDSRFEAFVAWLVDLVGEVDEPWIDRDQLEWLRTRLLELAQEKNRFLRHMSHELKTPLANIREGTELLLDGAVGQLDNDQREVTAILYHAVNVAPRPPSHFVDVPADVDRIMAIGMAKDRADRFATTLELAAALRAAAR